MVYTELTEKQTKPEIKYNIFKGGFASSFKQRHYISEHKFGMKIKEKMFTEFEVKLLSFEQL